MSKDLIRGFLLAHNAPSELLMALDSLMEKQSLEIKTPSEENLDLWPISVRTANSLHATGIKTKEQLLSLSESELLKIPNFGRKSLNELREVISPLKFADYQRSVKLTRNSDYGYSYPQSGKASA